MSVETVLVQLGDILPDYKKIRDCVKGQRAIKNAQAVYLPVPDPDDNLIGNTLTPEGQARYRAYLDRAVFYGVTGRTLRGLVGLVFDKDPAIELPASLATVQADVSGGGVPLVEHSKETLRDVLALGRSGLLTDYPQTDGPTTIADMQAGNIRPVIRRYDAEDIINWRTKAVGAKTVKSLVVLREEAVVEDDGFAEQTEKQYRVLRLVPSNGRHSYQVEIYKEGDSEPLRFTPLDGAGRPFTEIPFEFVGSDENDPTIDTPPLLDIAEINVAHYRNSADYEESVYLVGQPTPVFAGLTTKWVEDVFTEERSDGHGNTRKTTKIRLGSRKAIPLPVGGSATLLQALPNSMAFDAMAHKEEQMIALGAKLLENSGTQQTATEATLDSVLDNSVLANAARNVSKAYRQCLRWCEQFNSGVLIEDTEVIDYELPTDFAGKLMTAQDRENIVSLWVKRAITWEEMRWNLKRGGAAYEDDDAAKEAIDESREEAIEFEAAAASALQDVGARQPAPGEE